MDFNRFILTWLPHSLRRETLFSLLAVLISPIVYLYNLFITFKNEKIIDQAGTNQVIYLIKLAKDKLALNIDIVEDTGLPNDFIVKCETLDTDKQRKLVALINRYKQAGKSFTLNNAAITFSQEWGGYVCEQGLYSHEWGSYVCEQSQINDNLIMVVVNNINATTISQVDVTASLSPVRVQLVLTILSEQTQQTRSEIITHIRSTQDITPIMTEYSVDMNDQYEHITDVHLVVESDNQYHYILSKTINN